MAENKKSWRLRDMGPMRMDSYPLCPDETKYEKLFKIGQGTFGIVYKARNKKTGQVVAMKKVKLDDEKEGFPITAMREIKILRQLVCENVLKLIEVCHTKYSPYPKEKRTFYLIFEFCEHDLAGLLSNSTVQFTLGEIKTTMQQLLNGLYYIHFQKILHRDMKASNILITKDGVLKLADFGLARPFSDPQTEKNCFTPCVVTRWYRPPELLLGERNYTTALDMWGAGCIFAEFWTRRPILQGETDLGQLQLIIQLCGSITPEIWPDVVELILYQSMDLPKNCKRMVKEKLKGCMKDELALDLLDKLLILDPAKRYDSDTALNHDFFFVDPQPSDLKPMLGKLHSSMFEFSARNDVQPRPTAVPKTSQDPNQYRDHVF